MIFNFITKSAFFSRSGQLALVLAFLLAPLPALSHDPEYVNGLVREAVRLKLHEERGWKALLHYATSFTGESGSKIDDKRFFISPEGRADSGAELEATLRSFFLIGSKDGESTICRFPARYAWLDGRLHINQAQLPAVSCTERDKSLGAVDAKSAVLVFPVGHINSPASMFGHTLLRIDGSSTSNLISYAVNYAAANTDPNGLLYAWKGLTGKYKGYYSLMPYYDKVREYNNLEHRDMWEYRLNLTRPEVMRMLDHLWELQNMESSYYFLDENCSYKLMFLIEVARPELHLTDTAGILVLPSDTVRSMRENGLIEDVKYRASQGTKIRKIMSLLDTDSQKIAHDISYMTDDPARVKHLPVSTIEKIKILDLASGFVQFRFSRKELEKDVYSRLYLKILNERSLLGVAPDDLYRLEEPVRPEDGHGTTRISAATGVRRGELFGELNVRPEFHALTDPGMGYLPGAQIKFLDTFVRYDAGTERMHLRSLHILDIVSIAPRDGFFMPLSWKINTGFDEETLRDGRDHLLYRLNSGGGYSYRSPFGGIWYLLGELDINAGPDFRSGITAGPGISIGAAETFSDSFTLLLNASGYWHGLGDDRSTVKTSLIMNRRLTRNNSLSVEMSQEYTNTYRISEIALRWNYYY